LPKFDKNPINTMKKILALVLLFAGSTQIQAQEVGIIMGTAREYMRDDGVEATLIKLKNMGITYLEGGGARGMEKEEYKALLDKHGMKVVASGTNFDNLQDPAEVQKYIDNMKFYGAKYATCYWIPHKGDDFTFEDMKKGIEVFNKAGKQFAEAGISFLYHAHGYEFRTYDGPGTMFDYMMEKLDPRYVNLEMDVFWMRNPGQNPAELMRKYAGRVKVTHLKDRLVGSVDNLNGRQDVQRNVILGDGDVNMAEVLKAARETGVEYHFIEDESSRAGVQLPMHLAYLRTQDLNYKAVEQSVVQLHNAIVSADSMALSYLTTEELTYGHSSGSIENKGQFKEALLTGKSDFAKIDFNTQEVTVKGDVAWVRGNMDVDLLSNGKTTNIKLKILYVWTKDSGIWKLLARQAVR
jgi:sugar phosphate isomerase/epimerase/ketosteroid isomerase-like protein